MAHYAEDCWDAEVETSYGWVECAGLADRSAYDLRAHTAMSKTELTAYEKFAAPREVEVTTVAPNKKELGLAFKRDAKAVADALEALGEEDAMCLKSDLDAGKAGKVVVDGKAVEVTAAMVDISRQTKRLAGRSFVPSVIEPSFGIGRILYCVFEHSYYTREGDESRAVLKFTPLVAPVKATVFPLVQKEQLNALATTISAQLTAAGLSNIVDTTGNTIGKRYARTDEIGVPFAITVDFEAVERGSVTVRERDSTAQVRIPVAEVAGVIRALVDGAEAWADVAGRYPAVAKAAAEDGDA